MATELIGIAELGALTAWTRAVTRGTYTVRFCARASTAYIDGKTMVIPRLNAAMTRRDVIRLRGFCIHETSHPIYQKEAFDILKANPLPNESPLRAIYNMFLDVHAESCRAKDWPGDAKALSEFGVITGRDVTDNFKEMLAEKEGDLDPTFLKITGVMHAAINAEGSWNLGLRIGFDSLFRTIFPPESAAIGTDLTSKFSLNTRLIDPNETAKSLWELTKEVYEYLFNESAEEELKRGKDKAEGKGKDKSEGKGKGDEESEDGESGGDGDEDGDEDGDGEAEGKGTKHKPGDGDKEAKPEEGKIPVDKLVWSSHYEYKDKEAGASGMGFDYANHKEYQTYTPIPFEQFVMVELEKM